MDKQQIPLGRIIQPGDTNAPLKDAIHIAIAAVLAGTRLSPGQKIRLDKSEGSSVGLGKDPTINYVYWLLAMPATEQDFIGVIDPFLKGDVLPGDPVYILMNPYTITSLRHEWTHPHPAFATETK